MALGGPPDLLLLLKLHVYVPILMIFCHLKTRDGKSFNVSTFKNILGGLHEIHICCLNWERNIGCRLHLPLSSCPRGDVSGRLEAFTSQMHPYHLWRPFDWRLMVSHSVLIRSQKLKVKKVMFFTPKPCRDSLVNWHQKAWGCFRFTAEFRWASEH